MNVYPRATIVGAVADYLLGMKYKGICAKWGISGGVLSYYLRKVKCFKRRSSRGKVLSKMP
jgi:hypothetical protein